MLMLLFVKVRLFSLFYNTPAGKENRRGFFVARLLWRENGAKTFV